MEARSDYLYSCSFHPEGSAPFFADDCGLSADLLFASSQECACPADGLTLPDASSADPTLLQAVRMFLAPVDDEYAVGYSPFVSAGRSC